MWDYSAMNYFLVMSLLMDRDITPLKVFGVFYFVVAKHTFFFLDKMKKHLSEVADTC